MIWPAYERTIESLGNHRAKKVVPLMQPFLKHDNEQVRRRTQMTLDAIRDSF